MAAYLPQELLELALRMAHEDANDDELGIEDALKRRRSLLSLTRVSRSWHAVARELLVETIVIRGTDDLAAVEAAVVDGIVRGDGVRTLIVDDTAVERTEAVELAWRDYEAFMGVRVELCDRADGLAPERMTSYLVRAVPSALGSFARRLWRMATTLVRLSAVKTAYARTLVGCDHSGVRTLMVNSCAPLVTSAPGSWIAQWPPVPPGLSALTLRDTGSPGLPPLPPALIGLPHLRIRDSFCGVGFQTAMSTSILPQLEHLEVTLGAFLSGDPSSLWHIGGDLHMPSTIKLRRVGLSFRYDGLERFDAVDLLAQLPRTVIQLGLVFYVDAGATNVALDVDGPLQRVCRALGEALPSLDARSQLHQLVLGHDGSPTFDVETYCGGEDGLQQACAARGIALVVHVDEGGPRTV